MKGRHRAHFLGLGSVLALLLALPGCSEGDGEAQNGRVTFSGPAGAFFMTRYWSETRIWEKAAWYFAADGRVYENLENGVTAADLAAHKGPKGTFKLSGDNLEIAWAGKPPVER